MNQVPLAIGLTLCEQMTIEENTRNLTLVNCFNHRRANQFPSEGMSFIVLAMLTNGVGEMPIDLVIHRSDVMEETYRRTAKVQFSSPLSEYRLKIKIENLTFPFAGSYHVSLLADNEVVTQRKLVLLPKGET